MLATVAVVVVALLHFWFLVLEMFLWNTPFGHRTLRMTPQVAASSAVLAANQGLYNGLVGMGLLWGLWIGSPGEALVRFLLGAVVVAGLYGGWSASRVIWLIQALPAAVAWAVYRGA